VYSFGIVIWEILFLSTSSEYLPRNHRHLYHHDKRQKAQEDDRGSQLDGEVRLPLPVCPCWPPAIQRLVADCLSYEPSARPTMSQVRGTLQAQMEQLGVVLERKPRRRSTFRLDLSGFKAAAESDATTWTVQDCSNSNIDTNTIGSASKSKRSLTSTSAKELGPASDHRNT